MIIAIVCGLEFARKTGGLYCCGAPVNFMNPNLKKLHLYPFEKLNQLKADVVPPKDLSPIVMSIGEPKHEAPQFIKDELAANLNHLSNYPTTQGSCQLREAIARWVSQRFCLKADTLDCERHVLPVNGTREGLFAIAQCIVEGGPDALVVMANPFYQIYEGAAYLAGAKPYFLNLTESNGFLPELDLVPDSVWQNCQLIYICSPGNPAGAVIGLAMWQKLIELATKFDFVIVADECYSEIYRDEDQPPVGLLQAAAQMGRHDFSQCLVFHSLSKRSSVPGLRSGFAAGDSKIIERFLRYRTYQGGAMPPPTQAASVKAWQDEEHVRINRLLYRQKFAEVTRILSTVTAVHTPEGGFYLWLPTGIDDQVFARELYKAQNVTVLPGAYLSRTAHGILPGERYVRIALVPQLDECVEAANRIKEFICHNQSQNKWLSTETRKDAR